jgi:cobyric acid synthase
MDAIETTDVLDAIEIAVPKLNHFASWYDTYRKAQEKGVEMWFVSVRGNTYLISDAVF